MFSFSRPLKLNIFSLRRTKNWIFLFFGPLKVNIFSLRTTEIQYIRSAQTRQTDRRADGQTDRQIIALLLSLLARWRGRSSAALLDNFNKFIKKCFWGVLGVFPGLLPPKNTSGHRSWRNLRSFHKNSEKLVKTFSKHLKSFEKRWKFHQKPQENISIGIFFMFFGWNRAKFVLSRLQPS